MILFASICAALLLCSACSDDDFEPYTQTLTIASEQVSGIDYEASAFWVKKEGSNTWERDYTPISNFDYEPGYEYRILVRVNKIKTPGIDQHPYLYTLIKLISKEKKDSGVPPAAPNTPLP